MIETIADIQRLAVEGYTDWAALGDVEADYKDDLVLLNYTQDALWARRWNTFEQLARGLIINRVTGEVVARSFDKFFSWNEHKYTKVPAITAATTKIDGSMGILYRHNGEYFIATRGSFRSDQGQWATRWLNATFTKDELDTIPDEYTLIFEIIYPENRIVSDYGDTAHCVLLAVRNRHTGDYLPIDMLGAFAGVHGFTMPELHHFDSIESIVDMCAALGYQDEGYVVHLADGTMWKFKSTAYLIAHKAKSRLTFKYILDGYKFNALDGIRATIPDEFMDTYNKHVNTIESKVAEIAERVETLYKDAPTHDRRLLGLYFKEHAPHLMAHAFCVLDGKSFRPLIYKHAFKRELDTELAEQRAKIVRKSEG